MGIKDIIESQFGLAVQQIHTLGQGMDSVAYLVNHLYIFKQSKHDEARAGLKKEIQILNYIKNKITLQIPAVEFYCEKYGVCGYKLIKGDILTPDIYQNMSCDEKNMLAQDIARFLGELHSVPLPDIQGLVSDVAQDYASDYRALKNLIYHKIPDTSKLYLDNLFANILSDPRIVTYVSALCHNDLSCKHMIVQNNALAGIIDFGDAAVTDRDRDFVYLLENSKDEIGRDFGMKVLDYYQHPDKNIPVLKADLNEVYYPVEQILGGLARGLDTVFLEGLHKIINI